ncbi:MAG: hypothetical protein ACYTF3_04745 [Planctomycetota bacterium]|jgi:hypothetical protein
MIFLLLALPLPVQPAPGPSQTATIRDLGTLSPNLPDASYAADINHRGHVTGHYMHTNLLGLSTPRAFRWDEQGMTSLSDALSNGMAIGDDDRVVGFKKGLGFGTRAHEWEVGGAHASLHVGTLLASEAVAVNAQGEVAGSYDAESGIPLALRQPFLRSDAMLTEDFGFPPGSNAWAVDLNERGDLLGNLEQDDGSIRGFLRRADGSFDLLPDLGGGSFIAMCLNDRRHVAGLSLDGSGAWHPVVLSPGGMVALDTLVPGGEVYVLDLDEQDRAVGFAVEVDGAEVAVLWEADGSLHDLNQDILPSAGWQLTRASGINGLGEICGNGIRQGEVRAWRMTPGGVDPAVTGVVGGLAGAHHANAMYGRGFTPQGDVALYGGFEVGSTVEPLCGAVLSIARARPMGTTTADADGRIVFHVALPAGVAGEDLHVQAVDLSACGLSPSAVQPVF